MVHLLLPVIYIAFISLGLPDALLGSAWPVMHQEMSMPVSYAGILSMIIAVGSVISSLMSDRLTHRLGTGKVTAFSVAITAAALLGFSMTRSFWVLCLWAIPYGLGAGSVDASLNNYVALHYQSRHMSWLHCMWGVGATLGPIIMGAMLSGGHHWSSGYRIIGLLQVALTIVLFMSLPMWKKRTENPNDAQSVKTLSLRDVLRLPGAKEVMISFFCYCALEQTSSLWASSYLALYRGVPAQTAASLGSMFFIGITIGRGLNGFLTFRFTDTQLIRIGEVLIALGIAAMLLPLGQATAIAGLIFIGLGCAPIYPCIIHSTPAHFGEERSQALIGVQMASAQLGICLMPPLFGLIANHISVSLLPFYLLISLVCMAVMYERLLRKCETK